MSEWKNSPFKETKNVTTLRKSSMQRYGDRVIRFTREFVWGVDTGSSLKHTEGLSKARELFKELTDTYGIEHAGFMPVVGRGEGGLVGGFVASNWIEGEPCVNPLTAKVPANQKDAAKDLLEKLSTYALDKHAQKEPMLTDIFKLEQYTFVPERNTMVLVDTDPYFYPEIGGVYAYEGLSPLARQVLDKEAFTEWDVRMSKLNDIAELVDLGQDF